MTRYVSKVQPFFWGGGGGMMTYCAWPLHNTAFDNKLTSGSQELNGRLDDLPMVYKVCANSSHEIATQPSHSVDRAGWQTKMASIELPWRNVHRLHCTGSPFNEYVIYYLAKKSETATHVKLQVCAWSREHWRGCLIFLARVVLFYNSATGLWHWSWRQQMQCCVRLINDVTGNDLTAPQHSMALLANRVLPIVHFTVFSLCFSSVFIQKEVALAKKSVDHWIGMKGALTGFCRAPVAVMSMLFGRRESFLSNVRIVWHLVVCFSLISSNLVLHFFARVFQSALQSTVR